MASSERYLTKSELIEKLSRKLNHLPPHDIELSVKNILKQMGQTLFNGDRIEVRGFGSFLLHHRPARIGRNPKTGISVTLPAKFVPHFKPGKELRERVNEGMHQGISINEAARKWGNT
jgi:integration host factor subunit beta